MHLNWSLCLLSVLGWAIQTLADRLVLSNDAYARVTQPLDNNLESFTLSAWVNVTQFTNGITPILTYLDQNASSQVSFFMRPSGVGVLWGGPIVKDKEVDLIKRINRRPRLYWSDLSPRIRRKRDADYSAGLGDIVNIMERSGRVDNSWSPLNFVDVGVMGVDDLMTSGSENDQEILTGSRSPRNEQYADWTNVPFELHMEESIQSNAQPQTPKEPRIITKPSGGDDFVYFNWNVPQHQPKAPLGGNSWSPIWESTKTSIPQASPSPKPSPSVQAVPLPNQQAWLSPEDHNQQLSNEWNPVGFEEAIRRPDLRTKFVSNVERPVWPSNANTVPISTDDPNKEFKNSFIYELPTASISNILPVVAVTPKTTTTARPTTTTPQPTTSRRPTTRREVPYKKYKPTTPIPRRKIVPTFRPTPAIRTYETPQETTTKGSVLKKERTRTPLWKLIKKPVEHRHPTTAKTKSKEIPKQTNEQQTAVTTNNKRQLYRYSLNDFQNKPTRPSRPSPPSSLNRPRIQPDRLRTSYSTNKNAFVQKAPQSILNRYKTSTQSPTTTTTTTTKRPKIKLNPPMTFHKSSSDTRTNNRRNQVRISTQNRRPTNPIRRGEDEFSKTMKDPKLVQEGNTAVVYAIPIQDEDEFYKMYRKYQEQSERSNIHLLYQKMRKGGISDIPPQEEEENENTLHVSHPENDFSTIISETDLSASETINPTPNVVPVNEFEIPNFSTNLDERVNDFNKNKKDQEEYIYEYFTEDDILIPNGEQYEYVYADEEEQNIDIGNNDIKSETAIKEASAAYYIPSNEEDSSLADLYKEPINAVKQESEVNPSFYQEPSSLSHQQLPPTYQKPEKEKSSGFENVNKLSEIIYSADPQILLAQGLLPRPIHAVDTKEEAEQWMEDQKKQTFIPQEIFSQPTVNVRQNPVNLREVNVPHNIPKIQVPPNPTRINKFSQNLETQETRVEDIIQPRVPDGFAGNSPNAKQELKPVDEDDVPLSIKIKELPYKFNTNGWYHIGFTWNGKSKKLFVYVNGEVLGEITGALKEKSSIDKGGLFLLGRTLLPDLSDFDETSQFLGEISDLNLWPGEFTPTEMDLNFQCKKEPSPYVTLKWGDAHMNLYNSAVMLKSPQFCGLVT